MSIKKTRIWRFFSSIKLAIWLLAIITVLSLLGTFIPQNQPPAFYIDKYGHSGYSALLKTGLYDVYSSSWFILLLALFSINLAVCLINRFSLKPRMLGSFLSHVSVLIILAGASFGMFLGQKGLIKIKEGEEISSFTNKDNRKIDLGFSIRLDKFIYSEHINPKERLVICLAQETAQETDKCSGAVAEVPVETGVESDIANTGCKIKVLRYLNDFVMDTAAKEAMNRSAKPNNPAIEVQFTDKTGQVSTFWVFARFPDMHEKKDAKFKFTYEWAPRRPKDFISSVTILELGKDVLKDDILVNKPLRFAGYTFFQSSYDTELLSWSGLQVAKDPGVCVVYAGFILLILGLVIIFYINPLIQRK